MQTNIIEFKANRSASSILEAKAEKAERKWNDKEEGSSSKSKNDDKK